MTGKAWSVSSGWEEREEKVAGTWKEELGARKDSQEIQSCRERCVCGTELNPLEQLWRHNRSGEKGKREERSREGTDMRGNGTKCN